MWTKLYQDIKIFMCHSKELELHPIVNGEFKCLKNKSDMITYTL